MVDDDAGQRRVELLLEQILDSGESAEEVCRADPELLPEVRAGLRQLRLLDDEVSALFPPSGDGGPEAPVFPPPSELPLVPGYEVMGILGHGGMGIVYRARHLRLKRLVALKMILVGTYATPGERERFVLEAEAVASLRHSNIVEVFDAGEIDGRPYFTMELVEGGRLSEKVNGKPLPARKAVRMMVAIADAVHTAHDKGIIHRDLKPSNILLTSDGTPKVTDFGLARRLETEAEITLSGVPVGTPSYMAPEQARGDRKEVGPTTDVYALGAILYELLTGRPPFQAESATATLQQLMASEPVPPGRLNPRVPRDLETICLKCLHKDPRRRYSSAAALVDDLRRFERGEPITARPVSSMERGARWVRRRPAIATAMATGILLASALAFTALWWHGQRTALRASAVAYANADLAESQRLRDSGDYNASAAVLRRARDRLRDFVPPELDERLSAAFDNLELVTRLDSIRMGRALIQPQGEHGAEQILSVTPAPAGEAGMSSPTGPSRQYEQAFHDARVGTPEDAAAVVAGRVRVSPICAALVAALDDWAVCAANRKQQAWVLAVLRGADPDPWRDRVRDSTTWENSAALRELAEHANVVQQPPELLAILGAHLRAMKLDAVAFLTRVVSIYPHDFWLNIEIGNALSTGANPVEAIGYYRTALALRPQSVTLHYALGGVYLAQHRWDESVAEFEQAIRMAPENAWCHSRLGFALAWRGGRDDEALAQFREAVRLDPKIGWSHYFLAVALERKNRFEEAADEYQKAAQLIPEKRAKWEEDMRRQLLRLGRGAQVRAAWKEELASRPLKDSDWFGYAEFCLFMGDEDEYRRARSELLSQRGIVGDRVTSERVARACLLLPPAEEELREAVALCERALAGGRTGFEAVYPSFRFTEGLARLRQGRFDDAIKIMSAEAAAVMGPSPRLVMAMAQYKKGEKDEARKTLAAAVVSYDWSTVKADNEESWVAHVLRREAEAMISSR